jgi:hypothetical protein
MTIRGLMAAVVVVACYAGEYVYFERWEARRSLMYQQRDTTRSLLDAASPGIIARRFLNDDSEIHTRHWIERISAGEQLNRRKVPHDATISSANGWLSLEPITIEIDGSPSNDAWLDPLLRAYREKGWRYRVISRK